MYHHHHSQQQGPQPFPNGPRPPHHQPPPNQHQNRSPSNMLSQVMGFQFPRPTQLPDELESALAIRGARDMDHRLMDHMNRPNQHQSQGSGSGISQHGGYSTNPITLTTDNQPSHQQGVDWSSYQPPNKLFAGPQTGASHQSQRQQGPQQQPQSSNAGTNIPSWTAPANDSPSPQARQPHAGGSGGSGDGQALYTPESAGSILASFGLSNEDLEVLSHYPDDQLTPDTLPFILRDIQINKSGSQKIVASSSSSSSSFSRSMHDMPLPPSQSSPPARSCSPEVPSLLTVTQTAGKVIDYGHASRAKDESSTRETFKREPLSSERTVKMYPSSLSSSSAPKLDKAERRQVRLEHSESSKHGDQDYRRTSSDVRKSNRSPGREFPPSSKSRNLDRDYRRDGPKSRPSSETKSDASRRSLSSTSGSKPPSSKKLPTPTMISDFSAMSPKVYPHTCSLCHTQCEQEKDWVDHVNTVNHTAACRDLRNKYPDWKPNLPSRSGRYGSRALWDPKDHSPSQSVSRSLSGSPDHSPPRSKYRAGPHPHWLHPRPYSPHRQTRHQHYTEHHHLERSHSGSRSPSHSYRSSRDHQPERREGESSVGSSRSGVKRPHDDSAKFSTDSSRHLSSAKAGHGTKHGPLQSTKTVKSWTKPGTKPTKMASSKAADTSSKLPPAKKKKKVATPTCLDWSVADRLVYLTGIPKDASEQEVTDLVGSFGKINNVILMPCSGEESEKGEGQKASVCMLTAEDAHALAHSTNLSIRDQQITASTAKKPEAGQSSDGNSKPAPAQDRGAFGEGHGAEADQKTYSERGVVLITGFPESGWSESDVIQLIQPFGTPSDIIQATQLGKVLVSVPDKEIAQEIVKVHSFKPAKIMESELKMIHLKQRIGLSTPVALYNLLMGSEDPLESSVPVSWSSLLMISNVPNTPSGSSEVQKLVRRFGTVIKTLVLNNMVICEMATAAMAWSVYKRFQSFPCIIQNNPLFFSRKPDPKASTQTKVITAYLDPSEDTPANDKESQAAAVAIGEELAHQKDFESTCEGIEIDSDVKDEKMTSTEKMVGEDGALGENESKDDETKKVELTLSLSKDSAATESDFKTDVMEKPSEMETAEVISASTVGNEKTIVGEETKQTSKEPAMPALPQVTQEMVNALLVECRTRTSSHSTNIAASTNGEQEEPQRKKEKSEKAADQTKEPDKKNTEEEGKKQEMERNEREARKEREARERERKEKERRAWEKEERNKREREREERARRERRERERRQRKRPYVEVLPGSRMSCKLEGHEKSSWRDEQHSSTKQVEEEEESDDFPFNMSDFVTVDEVGDVADLPSSPPPSGPMETSEGGEDAPTPVQQDTSEPMEVRTETATSDASVTLMKSDERQSDLECVTVPRADTPSHLTPSQDIIAAASPSLPSQAEPSPGADVTPETEAALESTPDIEPLPVPADDASADPDESADLSSDRPATVVTSEDEKEGSALSDSQAQKEEVMSDRAEEQEEMSCEEDKETPSPAVESGKPKTSDDKTNGKEESLMKKFKKDTPMSTDCPLPPFNPNNPVGMEFLVPKTGFFCKVCNRFFSGTKEAEINHCKTLKHYESLQKFMQTRKLENVTVKPDSI